MGLLKEIWSELTAVMDEDVKGAGVYPGVAPGSGVDLGLEQREIETLHVALAAGVAQGLQIAGVRHLVLVFRRVLRKVLACSRAASPRCQRHFSPKASSTRGKQQVYALLTAPLRLSPWPESRRTPRFPSGSDTLQRTFDTLSDRLDSSFVDDRLLGRFRFRN